MANPTTNKRAVKELGSGLAWLTPVTSAGVKDGTSFRFGYISGTGTEDNAASTSQFDEGGHKVASTTGNREVTFKISPMQKDVDTLSFAPKTSVGNYYAVSYRINPDGETFDGTNDDWVTFGICQVERTMSFSTPGAAGPEVMFQVLNNDDALSLDLSDVDPGLSSVSIAANEIYAYTAVAT